MRAHILASILIAGSLAGCAQVDKFVQYTSTPQFTQSVANLKDLSISFANGACVAADFVTGSGVNITSLTLPKGTDPSASKTLARWQAGQAITQSECSMLAAAFSKL